VALKSIVIVGICLYGMVTAAVDIIHGGAAVQSSFSGMLYGCVAIGICLFSWRYLASKGKGMPDFVQAESEQWFIDIFFGGFVLLSFLISYVIDRTELRALVPYIDPAVVVCGSVYFIRVPLARLVSCVRELLLMAPSDVVLEDIHQLINGISKRHGFEGVTIRCAKIGRELALDIAFLAGSEMEKRDLDELDAIRMEVKESLSHLGLDLWLNVLFTKDEQWA
jgi:predicted Co/Zn/Cd cation transporter (cation efflux family)